MFLSNGLVLYPPVSMVRNSGFDGSGTHGRGVLRSFSKSEQIVPLTEIDLPDAIEIDVNAYINVKNAIWRQNGRWVGWLASLAKKIM